MKNNIVNDSNENESNEKLFALLNKGEVNLSEMKKLIESGADVNLKNSNGMTPLFISYLGKSKTLVEWLLNQPKIDLIHTEGSGNNGLSLIADLKDVDLLDKAIKTCGENQSIVINNKDNNGKTLLSWILGYAVKDRSWNDMIKVLVENDADANICSNGAISPLDVAVISDNHEAIKLLVPKSSAVIVEKATNFISSIETRNLLNTIFESKVEQNVVEDQYNDPNFNLDQNAGNINLHDENDNLGLQGDYNENNSDFN